MQSYNAYDGGNYNTNEYDYNTQQTYDPQQQQYDYGTQSVDNMFGPAGGQPVASTFDFGGFP